MSSVGIKNIVIVGLGLAGAGAANALAASLPSTHRIVAISEPECAYFPITVLRGCAVPGWEDKIALPLDKFFPDGSRHVVLTGTKVLQLSTKSVKVDKAHEDLGFGNEIQFDYAVLSMGSTYAFPCRPPEKSSVASVQGMFRTLQSSIIESKSIMVVGGGPVGIEFAAEVKYQYPAKRVTLVHSGPEFLDKEGFKPSLSESLVSQLKNLGIKVVFNKKLDTGDLRTGEIDQQTFDLGEEGEVEADFLFLGYGCEPNTSLVKEYDEKLLNDVHRVKVRPSLQLASDPENSANVEHIFAIGDITDIPETKLWAHAQNHGPVAANNIVQMIKGNKASETYSPGAKLIVVCVGPNGGAGQIYMGVVIGAWASALAKSRSLFYSKYKKTYNA